jgi:hypothetical protein
MTGGQVRKILQREHIKVKITNDSISPAKDVQKYSHEEMLRLKQKLIDAKNKMNVYYLGSKTDGKLASDWNAFQSMIGIYKDLRRRVSATGATNVSNAWVKYAEIYEEFKPVRGANYVAFFNAELPGASLCAFNHYMVTKQPGVHFDWHASSLMPKASANALGDNYGLWKHNRSKWLMNASNDGDCTNIKNILDFENRIGPKSPAGGVDFYSHDAGMDVVGDGTTVSLFNEQELVNAKLHLGCALAGLLTLRIGGFFVAKQYTCFETFTWNLIMLYATMFEEFWLSKPLTSRAYNSEIYLVGKGFKGITAEQRDTLVDRLTNFHTGPFFPHTPSTSFMDILDFSRAVFTQTSLSIEENVRLFDAGRHNLTELKRSFETLSHGRVKHWLRKYEVLPIECKRNLPSNAKC